MNRKIYLQNETLAKMLELTRAYPYVENGGLIFGRMNPRWLKIYDVSDAGSRAKRSRYGIVFDNDYLLEYTRLKEDEEMFFIGTWHSHPPGYSTYPSATDKSTMTLLSKDQDYSYYPVFCITKWENETFTLNCYVLNQRQEVVQNDYLLF